MVANTSLTAARPFVDGGMPTRILIVDDENSITEVVSKFLAMDGHQCATAFSAREALIKIKQAKYDAVVSDICMAGSSGVDLLKEVKALDADLPVILMTGHPRLENAVEAVRMRADGFLLKPFQATQLRTAVRKVVTERAQRAEASKRKQVLERVVEKQEQQIEKLFNESLRVLAAAIEARDGYTGGHLDRVTRYALATGLELGLDQDQLRALWLGSLFHDVGKLAIPDSILTKTGPLTDEEYAVMKTHPQRGVEIIAQSSFLLPAAPGILHHQERWDGEGYPAGLRGEEISIEGRILAVCDAFDAMFSDRPYRKSMSDEAAIAELKRCAGSQFDPRVVNAFLAARERGFEVTAEHFPFLAPSDRWTGQPTQAEA